MERKRHIGNDIVNIIFVDGGPADMARFKPVTSEKIYLMSPSPVDHDEGFGQEIQKRPCQHLSIVSFVDVD